MIFDYINDMKGKKEIRIILWLLVWVNRWVMILLIKIGNLEGFEVRWDIISFSLKYVEFEMFLDIYVE